MDLQVEKVLELMVARSQQQDGKATDASDEAIEDAVQDLLQQPSPTTHQPPSQRAQQQNSIIEEDRDNYDILEEEKDNIIEEQQPPPSQPREPLEIPMAAGYLVAPKPKRRRGRPPKRKTATLQDHMDAEDKEDHLDQIRLGKEGARMMVAFGDGPRPDPLAVEAALLAARHALLVAIQDARALRRQEKAEYIRARQEAHLYSSDTQRRYGSLDRSKTAAPADMLYRARYGYDRLAYDIKCGFDTEQLKQLFPEELNAYNRWNAMHDEAEEAQKGDDDDEQSQGHSKTNSINPSQPEATSEGGHLEARAASFDVRTEKMKSDWYVKFSDHRQGSFLKKRSNKEDKAWLEEQQGGPTRPSRGRPSAIAGTWQNLSAATVKFLHWVGFDPQSDLKPPPDDTAQVLAFLCYDFMGRVVEKAIELRVSKSANNGNRKSTDLEGKEGQVFELAPGEQLGLKDIQLAAKHPSVRPAPLYSGADNSTSALSGAQLYFGPGFENRLEMEMEEMVASTKASRGKRLSSEEVEIRKKEDKLFASLDSRPLREMSAFPDGEKVGKDDGSNHEPPKKKQKDD